MMMMMKIIVCPISRCDSACIYQRLWGTFWVKDHSRNTISYQGLEAFIMYYVIGASDASLHRESTYSLIYMYVIKIMLFSRSEKSV